MKTYGEQFDSALKCQTREEAEHWIETEVDGYVKEFGGTPEEAVKIIKHNLGYMAGYCSTDTATKIRDLFGAAHPGYGAFAEAIKDKK